MQDGYERETRRTNGLWPADLSDERRSAGLKLALVEIRGPDDAEENQETAVETGPMLAKVARFR